MKTLLMIVLIVALLLPFASQALAAPQTPGTCSVSTNASNQCVFRLELWCIEFRGQPIMCWYVWVPC
jgi:hypothetical protein